MAEKKSKTKKKAAKTIEVKQQRTLSRMNPNQKEAIIAFMESHDELLNAAVSRLHQREEVEALWGQLTCLLNDLGHVPKTTNTWKKTWFDLKREVKAKLGPPPYPSQLAGVPGDLSALGQRNRLAALMTRAVRICQQHAAASLQGALKDRVSGSSMEQQNMDDDEAPSSPAVVEMSVKCEPPDFAGFDIEELQRRRDSESSHGKPVEESHLATALQLFAASQDKTADAIMALTETARTLGEVFRNRTEIEAQKVEALKQIAEAIRDSKSK